MLREIAFVLLFIFFVLKIMALYKLSEKDVPAREKLSHYKKYNMPSYIFLVGGVGILVYLRYFS